jgi:hypothetical protein
LVRVLKTTGQKARFGWTDSARIEELRAADGFPPFWGARRV